MKRTGFLDDDGAVQNCLGEGGEGGEGGGGGGGEGGRGEGCCLAYPSW